MSQAEALHLIEQNLPQIFFGLVVVVSVLQVIFRGRARLNRLRDQQASQQVVAASIGFRTPGRASRDAPFDRVLASLVDAPEKLGRFPRLVAQQRIQIQFEGQHAGMSVTIALHKRGIDEDDTYTPTTLACFVSPDIGVSAFTLGPAEKPDPDPDGILNRIERALIRVRWLSKPAPPIEFPGRTFHLVYKLERDFAVSIRDDFDAGVLGFFENNPGWRVEGLKGRLLIWREDVHEPSERIAAFLSEAAAVAQIFRRPPRSDA